MKTFPYVITSLPSWREHARKAIAQGVDEEAFLTRFHPANRFNVRNAYRLECAALQKAGCKIS